MKNYNLEEANFKIKDVDEPYIVAVKTYSHHYSELAKTFVN